MGTVDSDELPLSNVLMVVAREDGAPLADTVNIVPLTFEIRGVFSVGMDVSTNVVPDPEKKLVTVKYETLEISDGAVAGTEVLDMLFPDGKPYADGLGDESLVPLVGADANMVVKSTVVGPLRGNGSGVETVSADTGAFESTPVDNEATMLVL